MNTTGEWVTPAFDHDTSTAPSGWTSPPFEPFLPVHMSLIPVQTPGVDHRGHVIVFDEGPDSVPATRWAIVDPESNPPRFWSFFLPVASPGGTNNKSTPDGQAPDPDDGDIFCSGHAWSKDGKLFVAGGTVWDPPNKTFWAAKLAYIWDPMQWTGGGGWNQLSSHLEQGRYYPSVNRFGDDRFMVSGGFDQDLGTYFQGAAAVASTYEVFKVDLANPLSGQWDMIPGLQSQVYQGLEEPIRGEFNFYPRFHLLADPSGGATGWFFYAGFAMNTGRNIHDPSQFAQSWDTTVGADPTFGISSYLHYGSSVLAPIDLNAANTGEDLVMRLGGGRGGYVFPTGSMQPLAVRKKVEISKPTSPGPDGQWQSLAPMNHARMHCNAVLLPDASTLVIGGTFSQAANQDFVMTSEYLANGVWWETNAMASGRGYHSTAVLLPSGMVLSAGGEGNTVDYQLYKPPYFFKGTRPVITSAVTGGTNADKIDVGNATPTYQFNYTAAPGRQAQRVVLMRPGSVTHHSDFEQRYVALAQVAAPDNTVKFKAPPSNLYTPLGYYMLFVVDDAGIPSEAAWVQLR